MSEVSDEELVVLAQGESGFAQLAAELLSYRRLARAKYAADDRLISIANDDSAYVEAYEAAIDADAALRAYATKEAVS